MRAVLTDAGPLIALIHRDDRNHHLCVEAVKKIQEPLVTVWPVLTEAMYLLNFSWKAQDALWEMLETKALRLMPLDQEDEGPMRDLMKKYRDLPMDLADAALVRVAQREHLHVIFTLDKRDFAVYKLFRGASFQILP